MKKLWEIVKANPLLTFCIALTLAALLYYFRGSISQAWSTHQVSKQDAQIQQKIDAASKAGEQSEVNANTHEANRLKDEGRADKAWQEKEQAAVNSNLSLEPLRKARRKHEEVRKSRPSDFPSITDDELCAELAKRSIPCR